MNRRGEGHNRAAPCIPFLTPAATAQRDSAGAGFFPGGRGLGRRAGH